MVQPALIDVAGIEEDSITNGPGLRFVLFVQGCPHHCVGCHNPQTHPFGTGRKYTIDELYDMITSNPLQTGVTFSGGEPFCQAGPLAVLGARLKEKGYEIAVYTGFTFEVLNESSDHGIRALLDTADVIVDGRFVIARRDILLNFRGSDNQRILDVKASVRNNAPVLLTGSDWDGE